MEKHRIKIVGDGSGERTHVLIDGKAIDLKYLRLEITADGQAEVTLGVYVEDIDLDADMTAILEKIPLNRYA